MMQMIEMNQDDFAVFKTRSIHNVAVQRMEDFGEHLEAATTQARKIFNEHLPDGLKTTDHFFYQIKNSQLEALGYLWYGSRTQDGQKKMFIYDIFVEENLRGKGYGKQMLQWLEKETEKLKFQEISLRVLAYNHRARELYESMGFEMTNIYMSKKIKPSKL